MYFGSKKVYVSKPLLESVKLHASPLHHHEEIKEDVSSLNQSKIFKEEDSVVQEDPYHSAEDPYAIQYKREIDTNVVCIELSEICNNKKIISGEPYYCKSCKAVFNKYSKYENGRWMCEFCNYDNQGIQPDELPDCEDITYLIKSANQAEHYLSLNAPIVICIDISGSMSCSFKLSEHLTSKFTSKPLLPYTLMAKQYTSRLECIFKSLEIYFGILIKKAPNKRVGIITFSNEVTVYGDCWKEPKSIFGDHINNISELISFGESLSSTYMSHGIKDSIEKIYQRLSNIEENGPTALGPALAVAIGMADSSGSKIIICTDGIANVGVGNIELNAAEAKMYYDKMGNDAFKKQAIVSLISIVADDCKLEVLSPVCNNTTGSISKINPEQLVSSISSIIDDEILATNASLTVILHKWLKFREEEAQYVDQNGTRLRYYLQTIMSSQKISFEYKLKCPDEIKLEHVKIMPEFLPFQAQLQFTSLDGSQRMKVFSTILDISTDKEKLFMLANQEVLKFNALNKVNKLIHLGDLKQAEAVNELWQNRIKDEGMQGYTVKLKNNVKENSKNSQQSIHDDIIADTDKLKRDCFTAKLNKN